MTRIVLASESPTRARLLKAAGLAVESLPARVDEDLVKESLLSEGAPAHDIALRLAEMKAAKISAAQPDALVIGADQILVFDGTLISKSRDAGALRHLLTRLAGQTHELTTAAVLARAGAIVWRHVARAELSMRNFSDTFLDGYLARQGADALGSVGGYRLEGEGIQLFSEISGDYFAILGLPFLPLLNALRELGALET